MFYKILFILVFITNFQFISAQKNITLNNYKERIINIEKRIAYLESVQKLSTNKDTLCAVCYNLGDIYISNNKALSKKYFFKAIKYARDINDSIKVSNSFQRLGIIYKKLNLNDSAILYFNKALEYTNKKKNLSKIYSNIASLLSRANNTKEAIKLYHKSIRNGKKTTRNLSSTYNNLAAVFVKINKNDSAIYYYRKSLLSSKTKKQKLRATMNLGITYLEDTTQINRAKNYLIKSKKIAEQLQDETLTTYSNLYLAEYYKKINNSSKTLNIYYKILNSKGIKNDVNLKIEVLHQLYLYNWYLDNFKKAYQFQTAYHQLKDSIYSLEKNKAFNDIKTKYEVAEKDNKIKLLTKEKELEISRKKVIMVVSIAVIIVLFLIAFFLRSRIKAQKLAQQKEVALFKQELKTKKALSLIEGQESERSRLAKELHDGLGGQLAGIKSITQTINTNNLTETKTAIDKHLTSSIKSLRNISHDLSANFIKNQDFTILVHKMMHDTFINNPIKTEIAIFPKYKINELPERYKLNIYRILQESMQNILKHAKASQVMVSLSFNEEITILIEDNGVGFDVKNTKNGIGLQNIKDRLASLNGTLVIESVINKGTIVNINIPFDE